MFDVPSSDNDGAAVTPHKHTAKKRRVPAKSDQPKTPTQVKRPRTQEVLASAKASQHATPQQKAFSIRRKDEDTFTTVARAAESLFKPKEKRNVAIDDPLPVPKALPPLSDGFEPVSTTRDHVGMSKSTYPSSPKRKYRKSPSATDQSAPRMPGSNSNLESTTPAPVTPPRSGLARQAVTPDSLANTRTEKTFTYMSPSSLEMPKLAITNSIASQSAHSTPSNTHNLLSNSVTSGRSKLKDKLAARDGTPRINSSADAMEIIDDSTDEELCTTAKGEALQLHYQGSGNVPASSQDRSSQEGSKIPLSSGTRQTYTAKSRTLRKDDDDDGLLTSFVMEDEVELAGTSRRIPTEPNAILTRKEDEDMDFPDVEETPSSKLRNIHELREAGASARLRGETEAILEEIDSTNLSTVRWGLLNLASKLEDSSFANSILTTGSESRILDKMTANPDDASRILLGMALLHLLNQRIPRPTLEDHLDSIVVSTDSLLAQTQSLSVLARDRSLNLTKSFQQEFCVLSKKFAKTAVWSHGEPSKVTPRLLILQLLEKLARRLRDSGYKGRILRPSTMQIISAALSAREPALIDDQLEPESDLELKLMFSLLELSSLSTSPASSNEAELWTPWYLGSLATMLGSAPRWRPLHQGETLSLILRLCLNITNSDTGACDFFANGGVISSVTTAVQQGFEDVGGDAEGELQVLKVDNLVLALGFLINLAERSQSSQECFLQSDHSGSVPLHALLDVFATRWLRAFEVRTGQIETESGANKTQATSEEESRTNVPLGYLAVLLTFLCSRRDIRAAVAARLEGGTLRHLLVAADAFLSYNKKIAEDVQVGDDNADMKAHSLSRLEVLLEELKIDLT